MDYLGMHAYRIGAPVGGHILGIPLNKSQSSQVPGTSSSQFSSSGNFKFRNNIVSKKMFNKKHFRYCLLPFHAL